MNRLALSALALLCTSVGAGAQVRTPKPEDTEVWAPEPLIVTPGVSNSGAPSDAIKLFDGKNLDAWTAAGKTDPAGWTVSGGIFTVNKKAGDIQTKRSFTNFQLHIEWMIPVGIAGTNQGRGNSGVYLGATGDGGYELQILDSYENKTYVNGQAGSIYKQAAPLVNAMRKPGEWQAYDVIWTAPAFNADGSLATPSRVTALHNGVLIQNNFVLKGVTKYIGTPDYTRHGALPILLQAHGDPSAPISFRNIWIREL